MLPRLFPEIQFQCIPHEGKRDLAKSVPRKLRAWREPGVRFVVMRDQNSADCRQVKAQLLELCQRAGRDDVLVRVVCRELEAWYIGEPEALVRAFPHAGERVQRELRRRRFRNPDEVVNPSADLLADIRDFCSDWMRMTGDASADPKVRCGWPLCNPRMTSKPLIVP